MMPCSRFDMDIKILQSCGSTRKLMCLGPEIDQIHGCLPCIPALTTRLTVLSTNIKGLDQLCSYWIQREHGLKNSRSYERRTFGALEKIGTI